MIFVIDDDKIMAECIARATKRPSETQIFTNAIDAMTEIAAGHVPDLIFLDVLLDGPDGFTFLNELLSYQDTARIPVVIVSSLDFSQQDLSTYGVVGFLAKDSMHPAEVEAYVKRYI